MKGASACHICGRYAGFCDAVKLKARRPDHEVVHVAETDASLWDSPLIITGLMGVAIGAFQWSSSRWFVLTNYPARNDVLTVLDGTVLLTYIAAAAAVISVGVALPLALAVRITGQWNWQRLHQRSHALIPLAEIGVILGLSSMTGTQLRADGFALGWIDPVRFWALASAVAGSVGLMWQIAGRSAGSLRRAIDPTTATTAMAAPLRAWWLLFWHW
ncbi:MAG: hypothetical protein WAT09_13245 [Paracoccaceae bacterium]